MEVDSASRVESAARGRQCRPLRAGESSPSARFHLPFSGLPSRLIGMKPAGGISKSKLALHYLVMVKEVLGEDWLNNQWFRFGASSLANDVLMQIVKEKTGLYQSANYFSVD